MTQLTVTLSQALQNELDAPGIWAYAVYFDSAGDPVWTDLVTDGAIQDDGSVGITMPSSFPSGKVYFLVQSQPASQPDDLKTLITQQSDINPTTAATYDFRYDSFEVTLQGSSDDKGNLTSVNGFGLPMEVSVPYDNGTTATVGYGISADTLVGDIQGIDTSKTYTRDYTSGPLAGTFRAAISPAESVAGQFGSPPFQTSDWTDYIASFEGPQAQNIVLSGEFNGAEDAQNVWHNGGYFAYQLVWDGAKGVFWLEPLASSQIKGDIEITPADLANSIYSTLGTVNVYASTTDASPFLAQMNTGANNQWGKVLSDFLTGFTGGLYGETGQSLNPQVTTPIDLDQNLNWDPIYAFGQNLAAPAPASNFSDPYSEIFYQNSNSYGSGYSDALMSQYSVGGPLISVSEPGSSSNVPDINLTIFADDETPSGYTVPTINNYIAAGPGGYEIPSSSNMNSNITLNFATSVAHNAGLVLASTDTITLDILTSDSNGAPVWSAVSFDGAAVGGAGLWQNWQISYDAASNSYSAAPFAPPVAQPAGTMLIGNLPTATDGVSWYQIGVGDKTFNLYTTTSGGSFENPNYAGQAGALAVDGLATVTPQIAPTPTIDTFSVNFAVGDTVTVSPSLLVPDTANVSGLSKPDAPVAGTFAGQDFTALPQQDSPTSNSITTDQTEIAFAWTGANDAPGTAGWIAAYTNKIDAGDVARITLTAASGPSLSTMATADLDGEWYTGPLYLADGTYTVTMTSYLPTDTQFTTPLTSQSNALTLQIETGTAPCFARGTRIATPEGEIAVQDLQAGQLVCLRNGNTRRIRWLGHRHVDLRRHARPALVQPVLVTPGAFADGAPRRELLLSPDHAVFVDAMLIPIKHLVNGRTIVQIERDAIEYWHVELDRHEVLLAEGLPCESYLDTGNRSDFANAGAGMALHPEFRARSWADACARLVQEGPVLAATKAALFRRAGLADALPPLSLQVEAGRRGVVPDVQGAGIWRCPMPRGARFLRLRSPCWVPAHCLADALDRRPLGVRLFAVALDGHPLPLDSAAFVAGFHATEHSAEGLCRWTDGEGRIALPAGTRSITLHLGDVVRCTTNRRAAATPQAAGRRLAG